MKNGDLGDVKNKVIKPAIDEMKKLTDISITGLVDRYSYSPTRELLIYCLCIMIHAQ